MFQVEKSCIREFEYSGANEYEFNPSPVAQKLMESAYNSQNGAFMGYAVRFLASEYCEYGNIEKALELAEIAVDLYPVNHPGKINAIIDVNHYLSCFA